MPQRALDLARPKQLLRRPIGKTVNDVMDGLKYGLKLPPEVKAPMWLDSHEPATDWVVFQNGAVNVLTGEMRDPTPMLWVQSALKFDWLPRAKAALWGGFKDDLFPGDEESKACLEEWMGYCMTEETKFQKAMMFIGPKRSGKTTISNLIQALVGDDGYATLNFDTWTATENSRECLIGKRIAVFQDVRLKPGKHYGQSYDAGGISHVSASYLLQYIGEAPANIGRKNIQAWQGQLRAKFMVISNEVPNLNDSQGTLPSRFVKLRFGVSFFGREDVGLWAKLRAELPGIAARCVSAYQRLCARGRFVQPRSAAVLEQEVVAASDPFAAMFAECFVAESDARVLKTVAYYKFTTWCAENGRNDLKLGINASKFTIRLRDHVPNLGSYQPHGGARYYLNLRIRKHAEL
jgi:putative DNA primase/helicase